jgi:hypothetical protein
MLLVAERPSVLFLEGAVHPMLPLLPPAAQVARIGATLQQYSFERLYGAFPHTLIPAAAADVVQRSVKRYCGMLGGSLQRKFY